MFGNDRLLTLDTEIWVDEKTGLINHAFFEKPTCPNRVLHKVTALSEGSIRATLTQETVRRLRNCSQNLPAEEKQTILSNFAQKMKNSGHSLESIQYLLVHGVTKYKELVRLSELPLDDAEHRPLYRSKHYNTHNRKLHKILQKNGLVF